MIWKTSAYDINVLQRWAETSHSNTAMGFLREFNIVPQDAKWNRGNSNTRTSLNGGAIPAGYLAELAYEWDKDGGSDPADFVSSIEFEIDGHPRNKEVAKVLGELGR